MYSTCRYLVKKLNSFENKVTIGLIIEQHQKDKNDIRKTSTAYDRKPDVRYLHQAGGRRPWLQGLEGSVVLWKMCWLVRIYLGYWRFHKKRPEPSRNNSNMLEHTGTF